MLIYVQQRMLDDPDSTGHWLFELDPPNRPSGRLIAFNAYDPSPIGWRVERLES